MLSRTPWRTTSLLNVGLRLHTRSRQLRKKIEAISENTSNSFGKAILKWIAIYLSWGIPAWVTLIAIIIFIIISVLRYGEIFNPELKRFLREKVKEIKSEIKDSQFQTGYGNFKGFKGLGRFNDSLGDHRYVKDLAQGSFNEGVNYIRNNISVLEEIFEELDDNIENSSNKKKLADSYYLIRSGILTTTILRVNSHLNRHYEGKEDSEGRVMELVGWDDDLLSLWSKSIRLKKYI
jgi:hypothetical protein